MSDAEVVTAKNADSSQDPLVLKFGGSLVEQLGAQLYPSVTATVAELISNAWDADAENVWVTVPFEEDWATGAELIVLDDGHGMTRQQAQDAYLVVGRKRRLTSLGDRSEGGRLVHGRKGIGKLAAFGTAGYLECTTTRGDAPTAFAIDYDAVRQLRPDEDYQVEAVQPTPLVTPDGVVLERGTRIRLSSLRVKRKISAKSFQTSMSRRFALRDMTVLINGEPLARFSIDLQFRLPKDQAPDGVEVDEDGWGIETLPTGETVRWWIGFTEKPLAEGDQQGISVLARSKMAQRPFKFERSQGTTAQLGLEYLVGEVEADWLDQGNDIELDYIQSNRDQLQLEDARLDEFMNWGRRRLTWALRARQDLRAEAAVAEAEQNAELDEMLEVYTAREKRAMLGVAGKLARLPEVDQGDVNNIMRSVVNSRSDVQVRQLMEQIEEEDEPVQDRMWSLVAQFGLIDARRLMSVIEARIATIEKLQKALEEGAKEVPEIHNIVRGDAWLLDPRWHLLGDEIDVTTMPGVTFSPETEAESGNHLDYLFALVPTAPASVDEVVVVEIKRGAYSSGVPRKADLDEVNKFHSYVQAVAQHYAKNTVPPTVRGLMVAQGYTQQADSIRKGLEQIPSPRLEFKTWDRVLDETHRMHLGWLEVSRGRSNRAG
ncbi:ATP-binding protein [Nocardioides sp. NBC_00163]|uniref:ATP-binding protein n=1 Tax=Nocardioides sp. NBC_00163 TaxID=2975999 RepID=UPI00324745DD